MGRRSRFVELMRRYADDDSHGYSQKPPSGRWGPDFDCASLIYEAADEAGYPVGTGMAGDMTRWTGTMAKDFTDAGFQLLPFANVGIDGLKIGDVLLNLALHAEVYLGDGKVSGAQGSETGGFVGEAGDQTGDEIKIQPIYTHSHGWNYVLRPPDDGDEDGPDDISEGGNEMPMPYNNWMGQQGYNQQGYPQYRGYTPSQTMPQGNQQYNGYAQGYSQPRMPSFGQQGVSGMNGMQGYSQGYMGQQGGNIGLKTVMGVEEVASMPQAPGTIEPYFDVHRDIVYFKTVSAEGVPSICACEMHEIQEPIPQHGGNLIGKLMGNTSGHQVSREEFEQLKEMMMHGQQQQPGFMGQQGMEPGNASAATPNATQPAAQANGGQSAQQRNGRN